MENQTEPVAADNSKPTVELWDEIGFHRPLGGFWFKLAFMLISLVFGLAVVGFYYKYLYPFPESMGYRTAATGIFSLFFSVFDLGTHMTMDRFIAETNIKDPNKMVKYIQYFIWYQMFTGLIQTTAIAFYALFFVPRTELAYAVWIMLIQSTVQYPGFLGVFRGALGSLQQFNKVEVLNFVSGEIFQRLTEIGFVIWGRYWGMANPQIGEILGIAIGATIGFYVDDFFATWLSAWYFTKVMKNRGITAGRCFRIEFDWALVKETLTFGIKTGMPGIIGLAADLIMLWMWLLYVPQYTTFVTLSGFASGISGIINYGMGINLTQLFAESYMNDKKRLTQYYITQYIRFATMVQFFFIAILGVVLMIIDPTFRAMGLDNYMLAIPFIIPQIIRNLQQPFTSLADSIMLGTNHPTFLMIIRFLEEIFKVVFMWLWIMALQLPYKYGLAAIIWIMPCGIYPAILFKTITLYVFINKKILTVQINYWQTFVAPAIACITTLVLGLIIKATVFDPVLNNFNIIFALGIMIGFVVLMLMIGFFPIDTLAGGWDDDSMREFRKAAVMSGPSYPLVYPMYKMIELAARVSPLHNKFKFDSAPALQEVKELLELKKKNSEKLLRQES